MAQKKEDKDNLKSKEDAKGVYEIFDKEISRLSKEYKDKLLGVKEVVNEFADVIDSIAGDKSVGFYLNVEMETKNNMPVPNFDKLTFNFLFDDYEKPISAFNTRFLLGDKFDEFLEEEYKKDENGENYPVYYLKKNKNIRFEGNSISILRENCFDAIYDDLQKLGSSFIFRDYRGFISALKSIDIHRNMLLQKFEKYVVVYAGAGSWLRGEKSNDFDVFVVVDDTDVKRMPRAQVKEQLTRIIWQMAGEVSQLTGIQLHCQVYLLTDFWEALKDAHPVMFTFLRDGVPFYDRGIYSAWKELLKLGKIRPSAEAIDMHMNVGTQLIDRAKKMFAEMVMTDIYHSVLNPSQAILMLKGYNPTTPKETVRMFKEVLLAKEKCVSKKEVEILENTVKTFKKLEHDKEGTKVTGADVDKMIADSEEFLKKMKEMFEGITAQRTKDSIMSTYAELLNQMSSLPELSDIAEKDIFKKFEKLFVDTGKVGSFVKEGIKDLLKAKKDYESDNLSVTEVNKVLKETRSVLTEIKEYKGKSLVDSYFRDKKVSFIYDKDKNAELMNYDGVVYLIDPSSDKYFKFEKNGFVEIELTEDSFLESSKYKNINLNEDLISNIKSVLKTKEIYL